MVGAVCIASGPSLTIQDLELCKNSGRKIYVVNDVGFVAPWADYLYAADFDWWYYHKGMPNFTGEKWTCNLEVSEYYGLNYIPGTSDKIFADCEPIAYGKNSGFQIINLAFLHGYRDIWLLGYDLGYTPGTDKHFFGEHPPSINRNSDYDAWLKHYDKAAPIIKSLGINIINMSRKTNLNIFPKGDLCAYL